MQEEKIIPAGESALRIEETAAEALPIPEHAEKGSFRSMWELLMQLRALLPYLTRLAPLLDRGLLKAAPDMTDFRKDLQGLQTGSRELGGQVREQAVRLDRMGERMEEQIGRLEQIAERTESDTKTLAISLHSLIGWIKGLTVLVALGSLLLIILLVLALIHAAS